MTSGTFVSRPIIVGGCHRSGTSLVRRILNAHSRIYCGPETNFFRDFYSDYLKDPIRHARFMRAARGLVPENELLEIFGEAFISLHVRAMTESGKERWADKDPSNVLYLDQWQSLLGDDWLFVHVIRSPLDTLASIKELAFPHTIGDSLDARIAYYLRYSRSGLEFGSRFPERYYRVFYEQLVDAPESVVCQLMAWLGEDFESIQLQFNLRPQQLGLEDPKIGATDRIHADSIGRWRSILEPMEVAEISARCDGLWQEMVREGNQTSAHHVRVAITRSVPPGGTAIVLSRGDHALVNLESIRGWHFPQMRDGTYAGHYPSNSSDVISHLEELRKNGAQFLVIPSTSEWWLDHYVEFGRHLIQRYPVIFDQPDVCQIYSLSGEC